MKKVIYRMNDKGQFPGKYVKGFVPSLFTLPETFYAGETPILIDDFNMVELTPEEYDGLRLFGVIDGELSKFTSEGDSVYPKETIVLSEEDLVLQLLIKKRVINIMINHKIDLAIKNLFVGFSEEEIKTWTVQKTEAELYIATLDATKAPFLALLATQRNEDLLTLSNIIVAKANETNILVTDIMGLYQNKRNEVQLATDNATLELLLTSITQ